MATAATVPAGTPAKMAENRERGLDLVEASQCEASAATPVAGPLPLTPHEPLFTPAQPSRR